MNRDLKQRIINLANRIEKSNSFYYGKTDKELLDDIHKFQRSFEEDLEDEIGTENMKLYYQIADLIHTYEGTPEVPKRIRILFDDFERSGDLNKLKALRQHFINVTGGDIFK